MIRLLLLSALLTLAACGDLTPSPSAALSGGEWLRTDDPDAAPHVPTIRFDGLTATGFSGCRAWTANVVSYGANPYLWFRQIRLSKGGCDAAPARAAEKRFVRVLIHSHTMRVANGELTLMDPHRRPLAHFSRP